MDSFKTLIIECQYFLSFCRSLPVECLHTILLGPYKYFTCALFDRLSPAVKNQIQACIRTFNYSGFRSSLSGNICRYHQSFSGRDFKVWAQMCLFIIWDYLEPNEKQVWLNLSKVHCSLTFVLHYDSHACKLSVHRFSEQPIATPFTWTMWRQYRKLAVILASVRVLNPAWLHKPKFHFLLHLGDDMMCFGPTAAFNAERYSHAKLHLPVILFCVCADVKYSMDCYGRTTSMETGKIPAVISPQGLLW